MDILGYSVDIAIVIGQIAAVIVKFATVTRAAATFGRSFVARL